MQSDFMEQHYHHFDDDEENKFIYTDIHKQYVSIYNLTTSEKPQNPSFVPPTKFVVFGDFVKEYPGLGVLGLQ